MVYCHLMDKLIPKSLENKVIFAVAFTLLLLVWALDLSDGGLLCKPISQIEGCGKQLVYSALIIIWAAIMGVLFRRSHH